ncbi:cytochrome P450 4C1-like [Achroia grisella]|uniref:cytochrome P450 4C1-like n=1 Tax=Achroia grisella TaxID=688607 RepID=UPI0027D2F73A|nr:cytochrome P450 4C1-like [Achroia grisella]
MIVFILIILCVILYYLKFRYFRKHLYELSNRLPAVGSLPIVGHTHWAIGGPEKILQNIQILGNAIEAKGGISPLWVGPLLYVVVSNPDDVQKLLETSLEKESSYRFLRTWLGNGLFVAPFNLWKRQRRALVPIFANRVIEDYIEVFHNEAVTLVKRLDENIGKPEFDVFKHITSCTLDISFMTAMGEKMDLQHTADSPYLRARNYVMSIINMRIFKPWLQVDALFNLTPYSKTQQENIYLTRKFTEEVIEKRRTMYQNGKHKEGRKDLLELLLNQEFNNMELREHLDAITIAGNDTTALVISYTLLLLGIHQHEQEIVYNELQEIFSNSERITTKDDLYKMDYLERVIKESMRLYTVTPMIARETTSELKLSTCTLPSGVACIVPLYAMHRSKKLWGPDADLFNPDRFLPENSVDRHPCAYIPFSHGLRNCIGKKYGMLVAKCILGNVLRNYKVTAKACDRLKMEILLIPVSGHLIRLEKRT